jgi:hypothetical protein
MTKAERSLIIRKMASLGTPHMQRNGVTLISTSTMQGAYSLLWAQMVWTHSVTRAQHIAPSLSCCHCITFHPFYARNRNIWLRTRSVQVVDGWPLLSDEWLTMGVGLTLGSLRRCRLRPSSCCCRCRTGAKGLRPWGASGRWRGK